MLRQPEINVRIGTQYFRDLIDRFGGAHFALASYNAGESRVDRWTDERPGVPQDEFIDDIPFPETQNYVKRILGTAEDYRALYGGGVLDPNNLRPSPAAVTTAPAAKAPAPSRTTTKKKTTAAKKPASKPASRPRH
jgi:soluble lytic murein transglycosylase